MNICGCSRAVRSSNVFPLGLHDWASQWTAFFFRNSSMFTVPSIGGDLRFDRGPARKLDGMVPLVRSAQDGCSREKIITRQYHTSQDRETKSCTGEAKGSRFVPHIINVSSLLHSPFPTARGGGRINLEKGRRSCNSRFIVCPFQSRP